jgi:two-component system, NarL family, nitrate/nitrite response regulator NarL
MQKILIVDDHPLYREGMVSALRAQMADVEVLGADSAEEGLQLLVRNPDIDLVLIDVRLPGMDGFAALSAYGARFPAVSRILISGSEETQYLKRAFEAGASGYIPKSMSVGKVTAAIRHVLDGGVYVPDKLPSPLEDAESPGSIAHITLRQLEVLRLLGEGYTNKGIAKALEITERTAKAHVAALFEALGADNRTQAVIAAQRLGYLAAAPARA